MPERRRIPVLYVHHRSELGGAPASLSYLIRELDRTVFEPHVYCPRGPAAELFRAAGASVETGPVASFTHIWASTYRGRRWLLFAREFVRLPMHVVAFSKTLRRTRFELVHLNDSPLLPAALLARRAGLPVVWHLRSALPDRGPDRRSALMRATIGRLASATIAINLDVAESFGLGSTVVPNAVDLEQFRPGDAEGAKAKANIALHRPTVAYFGFLYPSKGFRDFIHVARLLRERGVEADYLIVGGAVRGEAFFRTLLGRSLQILDLARNYDREARNLVTQLGLEDSVRFIPFTTETASLYRACDVVVVPSRGPELGRPVIEAAASGIPVVTTGSRTGGGTIVPGKTGVLVDDFKLASLAEEIAELVRNPERRRRIGKAARAHAERCFEPGESARRIEEIYRRIVPAVDRTRVLFVHHRPQLGGAPSSLAHLVANLSPRFEPHVLVPAGPAAELFAEAGAVVHRGPVSIFAHAWDNPYEGLRWLVLGRELLALPTHVLQLGRLMSRYRFPIVHLNDSPLLPAAVVAHRHGAKIVWHLRSALAGEGRDRRSRAIAGLLERWGDAAIAIDRDVAERFPIRLPLEIVHNSVAGASRPLDSGRAKRRLNLPEDRVAIGFSGFVRRPKGWPELVAAARILIDEGVPAHFVIIGGGVRPPAFFRTARGRALQLLNVLIDEESAIKSLVSREGLGPHFSFLPFTPDIAEIYSALDIVTFPNQGVGLGRPVLEAAAHRKPVVASGSRTGAGLLLPEKTGVLVAEPTPERLAAALRRLIDEPALREEIGRAAAAHARVAFDARRNAAAVEEVYDRLLGLSNGLEVSPLPVAEHVDRRAERIVG